MANNILSSLLGGDEAVAVDGVEAETLVSGDAFASALAADHAKYDPVVAAAAANFLRDQSSLLKAQTEELVEERPFRARERNLRHAGQRLRLGIQVFLALVATGFGGVLLLMVVDAFKSQAVIVDPFDAPAALVGRGLTGKVVATGVLDELNRVQAATRSTAAKRNLSNAWTGDIKVEVPQTGLSISDIDRMLKARFGHDLHIGGDLVQTEAGGLALTVRGDSVPAKTFTGASADLDKLTTTAAEYIYGRSEP